MLSSYIRITLFKKFFIHNVLFEDVLAWQLSFSFCCLSCQFFVKIGDLPWIWRGFAFFVRIGLLLLFCSVLFCSVLFKENWSRNERTSFLWHTWSAAAHHIQFQIRFQSIVMDCCGRDPVETHTNITRRCISRLSAHLTTCCHIQPGIGFQMRRNQGQILSNHISINVRCSICYLHGWK